MAQASGSSSSLSFTSTIVEVVLLVWLDGIGLPLRSMQWIEVKDNISWATMRSLSLFGHEPTHIVLTGTGLPWRGVHMAPQLLIVLCEGCAKSSTENSLEPVGGNQIMKTLMYIHILAQMQVKCTRMDSAHLVVWPCHGYLQG